MWETWYKNHVYSTGKSGNILRRTHEKIVDLDYFMQYMHDNACLGTGKYRRDDDRTL